MQTEEISRQLAALSHPARLGILMHLSKHESCGCGDVVDTVRLAQSTVSQHLKVLLEAGLITHERAMPRSTYRLNREALRNVSRQLNMLVEDCCAGNCCNPSQNRLDRS
jgi:ArsR family transcriptional regulator, arsenate/arsenite/antimonite-responsive transcriptional repressor